MSVGLATVETATAVVEAATLHRRAAVRRSIRRELDRVVAHGLYLKRHGRTERGLAAALAPLFVEQIRSMTRRLRDLEGGKSIGLGGWLCRYGYDRVDAEKIVAAFEERGTDEAARTIEDWNDDEHDYVYELRGVINDWSKERSTGGKAAVEGPPTPDGPEGIEPRTDGETARGGALRGPDAFCGDKAAADAAAVLVRQVFDPKEWHDRLVDLVLPVLAVEMARAGAEYLLSLGVDVGRRKSVKVSTKQRAEVGTETTASEWLNEHPGNVDRLEEMLAASGQPVGVVTDMPMWMKKRIAKELTTSFKQPYWAKIHEATAGDAERVLRRGLEDGWSIRRMADEMAASFRGDTGKYAKMRATRIARTECLPGDTVVDGARVVAAYKRWYSGPFVEVVTEAGRKFSGTPNHPVLTLRGWVGLGDLQESDDLVCYSRGVEPSGTSGDVDVEEPPPTISNIFDSLAAVGVRERRLTTDPDFHGDGMDGEVDVLTPDGELSYGQFVPIEEGSVENVLPKSDVGKLVLIAKGNLFPRGVGELGGLCIAANRAAVSDDDSSDAGGAHVEQFSYGDGRFPTFVPSDDFVGMTTELLGVSAVACSKEQSSGFLVAPSGDTRPLTCLEHSPPVTSDEFGDFDAAHSGQVEVGDPFGISRTEFCVGFTRTPHANTSLPANAVYGAPSTIELLSDVVAVQAGGVEVDDLSALCRAKTPFMSFLETPAGYAGPLADVADHSGGAFIPFGDDDAAKTGQVEIDNAATIRRIESWFGHVFNLTTRDGYFSIAGGVYTGNSGSALNSARRASMDQLAEEMGSQVPMKPEWLSVLSDTTRDTHASLDGVPADEDGLFNVGGYRVPWPGHHTLPAGERCNCFCTLITSFGMDDETARGLIQDHEERLAEAEKPKKPAAEPVLVPVENRLPPGFYSPANALPSRPDKVDQLVAGVSEKTPVAKLPEVPDIESLVSSDDSAFYPLRNLFSGNTRYSETLEYALSRPETAGIRRQAESVMRRFPEQLERILEAERNVLDKRRYLSEALVKRGYVESVNPVEVQQRLAGEMESRLGVGHQSSLSEAMYYYTENGRSIRVATHEPKYFFEDSGVNIVPHQMNSDVELPYGSMYHPGRIADWAVRRNRKLPKVDVEAALERIGRTGGKLNDDHARTQVTVIGLKRR